MSYKCVDPVQEQLTMLWLYPSFLSNYYSSCSSQTGPLALADGKQRGAEKKLSILILSLLADVVLFANDVQRPHDLFG
jgi:hypothetical protein